ncbi:MAG: protein translocase subunit SecD [Stappiaceae bacterium]
MLYFARWKIVLILVVIVAGFLATLPNFIDKETLEKNWPSWLPSQQLVLGLDLQGGAYLLFEVDKQDYQTKQLENLSSEIRRVLRQSPRIGYTGLAAQADSVQVRIRDTDKISEAEGRLAELVNPLQTSLLGGAPVNEFALDVSSVGLARFTFTEDGLDRRISGIVNQSIEVIRNRIDELGTTEPSIQRQGFDRILVEAPGEDDPERLKRLIGETAQLSFHLVDSRMTGEQALQARPPAGSKVLYSADDPPIPYVIESAAMVEGDDLVDAQTGFDQQTNEPLVTFRFNTSGAQKFGLVTQQNVGRPFAIVLDDHVISAPVIREAILGGSGQISGNFTVEGANDLAILLRAGALPARLNVLEERTVGAGLGADSVEAGKIASLVGAAAVVIFMFAVYGLFGLFANLALFVNVALVFGALSFLGATLTLPGIAGIVLTIGMAVDANVLIFERIKEEMRLGRSAINAIDAGFSRALGTILDANITTLIAAVILFYLGSGPIKGFSVTLAIGIVTTVFSAFTFTRFLVAQWVRMRRPSHIPI